MVVHVMQMIDNRKWNETHATAEKRKGSVIKSLGEDTRIARVVVGRTHVGAVRHTPQQSRGGR